MKFFIAGITGNVGSVAARQLLDSGHGVVALTRQPEKVKEWKARGADVRQVGLDDGEAVRSAMDKVDGAFLMIPPTFVPKPGFPEARAVIANYVEALQKTQPGKIVVLSSFGSQQTSGLGSITATHLFEEALKDTDLPLAFVRPGSFLENYVSGLGAAADTGVFYSFQQPLDRKIGMVATVDIGHEVAKLLSSKWSGRRIIELGGYISPNELAAAMGEVLGRKVEAQAIPRERWAATIESLGIPHGQTWLLEEVFDGHNSGWIDFGVPGTESVAGTTTPTTVFASAKQRSQP